MVADSLVIIPTYNEKENIEKMVRKVFSLEFCVHLLIVDDASLDGTAKIVKKLQQEFSDRLFLIERSGKLGLGTAYIRGFKWGLARSYKFFFEMDCDFSHNPDDLVRLYEACYKENYDLSIGSRYIRGANVVNWPLSRIIISYGASLYVRIITGMKIKDATSGFKCYSRKVLEGIDFIGIIFKGYGFQIAMKYLAWKKGFKIKEVPIIFVDREHGQSKMNKYIFYEAMYGVLKMRFESLFKKIFNNK